MLEFKKYMEQELKFEDPFVIFATTAIKNTSIKNALDFLQTQNHLNINLLLYALWHGLSQHGRLLKQDIKALLVSIHPWHERVLLPLKHLGEYIRAIQELVFPEIQAAENIERQLIANTLFKLRFQKRNPAQQLSDACYNIASYCKLMDVTMTPENQHTIITLLQTSFPNLIAAEITHAYESCLHPVSSETQGNFSQLTLNDFYN